MMQRLHVDDLVGHVLEKENWEYLGIPAIADERRVYDLGRGGSHTREAGEVLDEERLNRAALGQHQGQHRDGTTSRRSTSNAPCRRAAH